jgi:hypothetical protein
VLIGGRFGCVGHENPTGDNITRMIDRSTGVTAVKADQDLGVALLTGGQ